MRFVTTGLVAFGLVVGVIGCGSETEAAEEPAAVETAPAVAEPAGDDEGAAAAASGEEAPSAAGGGGPPSVGDSCEGQVGAGSALMACNGQQLLFCSSFSQYAWQQTQVCPEGTTCRVSEDMTEGSCE